MGSCNRIEGEVHTTKKKMRPSKLFQIVPVLFIEKIIVRNI